MTQPYPYDGSGVFSPKDTASSIPRKQVSLGGGGRFAFKLMGPVGPVDAQNVAAVMYLDADFDPTNAYVDQDPRGVELRRWSPEEVEQDEAGVYAIEIGPEHTSQRGLLTLEWSYRYADQDLVHVDHLVIREAMPTYDALRDEDKAVVEQVQWMFADLFDSTNGGPNLTEQFQSHFGPERIAQLMHLAINRINMTGPPMLDFSLLPNRTRMPDKMRGFLTMATYLEALKHLMRSYVEQPNFVGMNVTYTDRRDYLQRWQTIYETEKRDFDQQLKYAKRDFLPLGSGALLVSGGIYGSGGRYFRSGMYAAQVRSARFYPYSATVFVRY